MEADPCAGNGEWRMPAMKDFEAMLGWTESHPWSEEASDADTEIGSDQEKWTAAFSPGGYWSSDKSTTTTNSAWNIYCNGGPYFKVSYGTYPTLYNRSIRCVQKKK